jgi:protein-tyrosine phosphatase
MKQLLFLLLILVTKIATAQVADSSKRLVKLQGAINVRDIGGYKTKDNKQVKWGKIYRSAEINNLTASDIAKLESLSINYILDFRGIQEAAAAPDKIPDGCERISLSAGSNNIENGTSTILKMLKETNNTDSLMMYFYTVIDSFPQRYKPMFNTLLNQKEDKAILYHCTAGKDRTGIATALILYALGVDEETIMQDYEASNVYRAAYNEKMSGMLVKMYGINQEAANALMGVNRKYLQATFNTITARYGTINNYLAKEMGLKNKQINKLKAKYLETL